MSDEKTIKCPICGKPYVVVQYYEGDQSACPECRARARKTTSTEWHQPYNLRVDEL